MTWGGVVGSALLCHCERSDAILVLVFCRCRRSVAIWR